MTSSLRRIGVALLFFIAPLLSFSQTPCINGMAGPYPCESVDLLSIVPTSLFAGSTGCNDIWGWTGENNREFALVGTKEGTAFVEVTDPIFPVYLGFLPTHSGASNTWRDIKVYSDHAFIVSEMSVHGMQVFDLNRLITLSPDSMPMIFDEDAHYDGFGRSHNIAINEESGYAYPIGDNDSFDGGPQFINIQNPLVPVLEGGYANEGYSHDAQIVIYNGPDLEYVGREVYIGAHGRNDSPIVLVDVTDKSDPQLISKIGYEEIGYCHQGWLTDDHRYFLSNDETDETVGGVPFTRTYIWDFQNLESPVALGFYESPSASSDHNLYVKEDYCYQSNYQSGLRILDISNIGNGQLEEVAHFDLYPQNDEPGYRGTWSNYPYFESGNIIITHRDSGLFVLRATVPGIHSSIVLGPDGESTLFVSPESNQVTINLTDSSSPLQVVLYDVRGRNLDEQTVTLSRGAQVSFDTSGLRTGMYLVSVIGDKKEALKFVIE